MEEHLGSPETLIGRRRGAWPLKETEPSTLAVPAAGFQGLRPPGSCVGDDESPPGSPREGSVFGAAGLGSSAPPPPQPQVQTPAQNARTTSAVPLRIPKTSSNDVLAGCTPSDFRRKDATRMPQRKFSRA